MNSANRGEFSLPVKDVLIPYIEEGKRRAKEDLAKVCKKYIYGGIIKGVYFSGRKELEDGIDDAVLYPVALGPYGTTAWSEKGGYLSQIMDAAFSAMCLTAYYFYTLDGDFLREIYEFLRLNINFYIGWREKEELGNGKYRYNLWSGAHEETFEMNSPMVLGCVKNILKCVLDGFYRGYLEVDDETVNIWRDFLDNIAEYPIRRYTYRKGFKKQVYDVVPLGEIGMNVGTGATVALEFIQPCDELDFSSDKRLMEACRNLITVNKLNNRDIFRQINNLPKIFVHAVRCEYDREFVLQEFLNLYRNDFRYNYTVDDGDVHGVEKSGGTEFINSMLIQSNVETIKVFPNWLRNKSAYFVNLRARGAYVVSAWYDGEMNKVTKIEITSEKQNPYSRRFGVHGTAGMYQEDGDFVFFEDDKKMQKKESAQWKIWRNAVKYAKKYDSTLWRKKSKGMKKSGHGGMDYLVLRAMVHSAKGETIPPIDVYDAAAWMCITALSEQSISQGTVSIEVPDFTRGKYKNRTDHAVGKYSLEI